MLHGPPELRLLALLLLNLVPLIAAYRLAKRLHGGDRLAIHADTALLHYGLQYVAVGLTGLIGVLSMGSLLVAVAGLCGGVLLCAGRVPRSDTPWRPIGWPLRLACLWLLAFLVALLENGWISPPLANDPLIYHLPAAVQWLQTGSLGVFETWFHNPTNTYSPLAGSMYLSWWMAPIGNDFVARYGQMPALALLILSAARLARDLGVRPAPAAMLALSAVLCRPVIGQTQLAKDDLFVAAFFMAALSALSPGALRDRFAVVRLGLVLGLLLATKYSVAYALPTLLLAMDAPRRAGWSARRYLAAATTVVLLAGPWFLRNTLLGGSPLFPVRIELLGVTLLPGPLRLVGEPTLQTWSGFRAAVIDSYYGTTVALAVVLAAAWAAAWSVRRLSVLRDPLARAVLLGTPLALLAFAATAPYAEARFLLPSILALILCPAWLTTSSTGSRAILPTVAASAVLLAAAASSFIPETLRNLAPTTLVAFAVLLLVAGVVRAGWAHVRVRAAMLVAATCLAAASAYVFWEAYLEGYRVKIERDAAWTLPGYYDDEGRAWLWARRELPERATVAVVNTPFVYPLQGFEWSRRVVHVSSSASVATLAALPTIQPPLRGDDVVPHVVRRLRRDADRAIWLNRLDAANADYVFIALDLLREDGPPPELAFCASAPADFERVFANGSVVIYRRLRR